MKVKLLLKAVHDIRGKTVLLPSFSTANNVSLDRVYSLDRITILILPNQLGYKKNGLKSHCAIKLFCSFNKKRL